MAKEIERRFLVPGGAWRPFAGEPRAFRQFYLAVGKDRSIRVRISDERDAWLTTKFGETTHIRDEFEYPIPVADAREMAAFAIGSPIVKQRYLVDHQGYRYEVDVFAATLQGLVIAELETPDTVADALLPQWLGREITGDNAYSNASLALNGMPSA
jgi:adenylate cyclase